MPSKYPVCTSADVVRALKKAGFSQISQTGSHLKLSDGIHIVIVPIHARDIKTGTLKGILEQAEMTVDEFKSFL